MEEGKRHLRTLEENRHEVNKRQKRCCSGSDAHHPDSGCSLQMKTKSRASQNFLQSPRAHLLGAREEGGEVSFSESGYVFSTTDFLLSACQDEPVM